MQLTHEKSKAGPVAILVLVSWLGMGCGGQSLERC